MKILFRIFLYLILTFIVLVAVFNILYLVSNYFLSSEYYQKLSVESPAASDTQSKMDYCDQIGEELNFITVTKYLDTLPPTYYSWKKSDEGVERENKYYIAVCSVSLQAGRKVTEEEANRLAQYYVIPQIELFYGLLSRWWLWILAIISLRRLIVDLSIFIKRKKETAFPRRKRESSVK